MKNIILCFIAFSLMFLNISFGMGLNNHINFQETKKIIVTSSLGHNIINADVKLYTIQRNYGFPVVIEEYSFRNIGNGLYELHIENSPSKSFRFEIKAPDHADFEYEYEYIYHNHEIRLYHNNYYDRCNSIVMPSKIVLGIELYNRWDNCSIDEQRLVESFGLQNYLLFNKPQLIDNNVNEDRIVLPLFRFMPGDYPVPNLYESRKDAYETIIQNLEITYGIIYGSILSEAIISKIDSMIDNDFTNIMLSSIKFSNDLVGLNEAWININITTSLLLHTFELTSASFKAQKEALLFFVAYQSSLDVLYNLLEKKSEQSVLSNDKAFRDALESRRMNYNRNKEKKIDEILIAYQSNALNEKLEDIIFSTSIKLLLKTAGASIMTSAGIIKATIAIKAAPLFAAYLIYDLDRSIAKTRDYRALLLASLNIDRYLFGNYHDYIADNQSITLSNDELIASLLRIQTGIMFNEVRIGYLIGDSRTWIRRLWNQVTQNVQTEKRAYDLEKIRMSIEKNNQAEKSASLIYEELLNRFEQSISIGTYIERWHTLEICDTWSVANSGGHNGTVDFWDITILPSNAILDIRYNMYSIPDKLIIEYPQSIVVFNSGWRGSHSYAGADFPGGIIGPGIGQELSVFTKDTHNEFIVSVTGGGAQTLWEYQVRCRVED